MFRKSKSILFSFFLILIFAASVYSADTNINPPGENIFTVWRVYNADLLRLAEDEKLVLAGIDSPEYFLNRKQYKDAGRTRIDLKKMRWAGKQAHKFTKNLVQGKRITVENADPARDSRKRLVGYAYLQDGTFVNAELVKAGYARVADRPGQGEHHAELLNFQEEARKNNRGLWAYGIFQKFQPAAENH